MTARQAFRTAVIFVAVIAVAYFLYLSLDILTLLLVAFIIALALRGPVRSLEKRKVPKGLAILIIYGILLILISLLALVILPPAIRQSAGFLQDQETLVKRIVETQAQLEQFVEDRTDLEITLPDEQAIRTTITSLFRDLRSRFPAFAGDFGGLFSNFVLVFVVAAYIVLSLDQVIPLALRLFPTQQHGEVLEMFNETERAVGDYVRGAALVAMIVGILDFLLLTVFGVANAGILALIVATTTTIPVIGGYIGAITATGVALLSSPRDAVIALIVILAVQQLENYVLSPNIIERTVKLNPVISIVSILIGFTVAGVIGALIAVPVAAAVKILVYHLVIKPRMAEAAAESAPVSS
jgi:predicted PurR-regulated permease PerM